MVSAPERETASRVGLVVAPYHPVGPGGVVIVPFDLVYRPGLLLRCGDEGLAAVVRRDGLANLVSTPRAAWPGLVSEGRRESGYMLQFDADPPRRFFVKLFDPLKSPSIFPRVTSLRNARLSFLRGITLLHNDLATPLPLAYGSFLAGPNRGCSLVVKVWLDQAETLGQFLASQFEHRRDDSWFRRKRLLITALAGLVKSMHQRGFYHGDFSVDNILVQAVEPPRFFLIDSEAIRLPVRLSWRRIRKNLSEANRFVLDFGFVSRTDRLRFLRAYLASGADNRRLMRYFWRQIERESLIRLERQGRGFTRSETSSGEADD